MASSAALDSNVNNATTFPPLHYNANASVHAAAAVRITPSVEEVVLRPLDFAFLSLWFLFVAFV